MRHITALNPLVLAAAMLSAATPADPPICPHCRKPIGPSLDEEHRHATARCAEPKPMEPNRAREFLDRRVAETKAREADRRRAAEQRARENQAAAIRRLENAVRKRERKAAGRKRSEPNHQEPR